MTQARAFLIYLKNMKIIWLIISLLLLAQLLSTKMSLNFTHQLKTVTNIEVINYDKGKESTRYLKELSQNTQLSFIEQKNQSFKDKLTIPSQGRLVINENFSRDLHQGNQKVMDFYLASGAQNVGPIRENLALPLLLMNAEETFNERQSKFNSSTSNESLAAHDLFQVEFHTLDNGLIQGNGNGNKTTIPIYLAALFLLIFILMTTHYLPGMDQRRFRFYGIKNLFRQQFLVLTILLIAGITLITSFLYLIPFLVPFELMNTSFLFLFGILLYSLSISFFLINLGLRQFTLFLFIPWFILNMTLGGGLWGVTSLAPLLKLILPISLVITKQIGMLLISSIIFFIGGILVAVKKNNFTQSIKTDY